MIDWYISAKPREGFVFALAATAGMAFFHLIYGDYFPNNSDRVGIDFTYFLPRLLDGYFWFLSNGFFSVPWFTPSFCGGIPAYANPQSVYYSVTQLLTIFVDPVRSVYWTILIFEFLGFAGFYILLRGAFSTGVIPAVLGGYLFMFNSFFIHRLITGHLPYQAYMLTPFILYFMLRPLPPTGQRRGGRLALDVACAGMIFAYMVYSGMNSLGVPVILSIALCGMAHGALHGGDRDFWTRLALGGAAGVALSISKMAAMGAFASNFPRSGYPMLGLDSLTNMVWFLGQTLFFWPDGTLIRGARLFAEGKYWVMSPQYYEFSVSPGPLLIIIVGALMWGRGRRERQETRRPSTPAILRGLAMVTVIVIPIFLAFNFKIPALEAMLKKIPLISSHGHFTTWFVIYIPLIIIATAMALQRPPLSRVAGTLVVITLLALAVQTAYRDRSFYTTQYYNYHPIVDSYYAARDGAYTPSVEGMKKYGKVLRGWAANSAAPFGGDDFLTQNSSSMLCYEPIFGYWREKFPMDILRPGPAMAEQGGYLNLKNPACFIYPYENSCQPGNHFTTAQHQKADNFRRYKPFKFAMPYWQRMANGVTLASWVLALGFLAAYTVTRRIRRL